MRRDVRLGARWTRVLGALLWLGAACTTPRAPAQVAVSSDVAPAADVPAVAPDLPVAPPDAPHAAAADLPPSKPHATTGHGFVDVTPDPPALAVPGPFEKGNAKVPSLGIVLLGDLDEDGRDEVIFSPTWPGDAAARAVVYRYQDGALFRLPGDLGAVSVSAVADMDGDGHADLVLNGPGIAWGDGKGGFSSPFWVSSSGGPAWAGIALADIDGDGWLDILQARSVGLAGDHDVQTYLRSGPRSFAAHDERIEQPAIGTLESLGVARLDEVPTLVMSVAGSGQMAGNQPPRFYRPDAQGTWKSFTPFGPTKPDTIGSGAPMGAQVCDLDANGRADFVFALNPETLLWSDGWLERTAATGIKVLPVLAGHVYPPMGWAFGCIDVNGDGRLDLIEAYGNDASGFIEASNDAGPQPIKALSFDAQWHTTDRSADVGLGRLGQWHALSTGDIDGDGAPDLAVSGWGEPSRVYLNRTAVPTAALRLRTRHGQPAIAARVDAGGGRWDTTSISPMLQSDTRAFVTRVPSQATVHFADGTARSIAIEPGHSYVITQL